MASINHLAELFEKFPGIGPRQAHRFVHFLLRQNMSYLNDLAHTIREVKRNSKMCERSFAYFYSEDPLQTRSSIEQDDSRDISKLLIVEKDSDVENIERIGIYKGRYVVIGGTISLLEHRNSEDKIKIREFIESLPLRIEEGLTEIILGTSATPEGDATADLIRSKLNEFPTLTVSLLARGLSTGTELEYIDRDTLQFALEHREKK
jgi:recombination protein RecR